ncbi:MAG: GTP-binding protein, partial [Gemmatimonadetes bacterium]|nr:GTP-binding protein [Gemmatimonadota bacterium]
MATFSSERIRNIALVAHSGSGKTSIADAMFFASGGTTRQGRVDDKTSLSDFEPEEQDRGSSIQAAVLPCEWKGAKLNVLDTPGYADFRGEMLSGLRVADAAVIVIAAPSGIEVGANQAWQMCRDRHLPTLIVVNKLDRENTSFAKAVEEIVLRWGRACVPVQIVNAAEGSFTGVASLAHAEEPEDAPAGWHERLIEAVAETDDELTTKYLEGEALTQEELDAGLRAAVGAASVFPILATSTLNNAGIPQLLDAIRDLLPSPAQAAGDVEIPAGAQANFVFKTSADPFVGKLSYFRVYGAPLRKDSQLWNAQEREAERLGQIYTPVGKEQRPVDQVVTGDIGVVPKLSVTKTFQTLCDRANPVVLPGVEMPEPVYALAVTPATAADLDKMAGALARVEDEDPSLRVERVAETGETVVRGLGDVHVAMAVERVRRKFGINLSTS